MKIGLCDSGVGGLSVMKEVVALLPEADVIYLADTANCPYGHKSQEDIINLSTECVKTLISRGVDILVLACNTMTSAAAPTLRAAWPDLPIVGMEPAVKPAALTSRTGVVGVLATHSTLHGGLYANTKNRYAQNVRVVEVVGDGLVEAVEQNRINEPETRALVGKYVGQMVRQGADVIVLGCTHYPFLSELIKEAAGEGVRLLNPAPAVAAQTVKKLGLDVAGEHKGSGKYEFLSSRGDADGQRIRELAISWGIIP